MNGITLGYTNNRLTLIGELFHPVERNRWQGVFKCSCGGCVVADIYYVKSGRIKSCGCLYKESRLSSDTKHKKHGMYGTSLYTLWNNMIQRCTNIKNKRYKDYGGRGISVCKSWMNVNTFVDWAENNGYEKGLELDRKNNNKGYSPGNCRFVTGEVNCNNKRNNLWITAFGETKTCRAWSKDARCPVGESTLSGRIGRGWPPRLAITAPLRYKLSSYLT